MKGVRATMLNSNDSRNKHKTKQDTAPVLKKHNLGLPWWCSG